MKIDTLIHAKWVIPVEPEQAVYENYAVAVNTGHILDLLPSDMALKKYDALDEHHLDQHALIPGLINCHTHAAMTLFRGLADDLPLMDWLNHHIWPAEQQFVGPEFVEHGTRHAIAEMIRGGTTCFNDMYFFPDHSAEVAAQTGIRAVIGLIVIDFPTAWANNIDEYFVKGEKVHDKFRHNPLINTAFAPHAPYTVSEEPLNRIVTLAEELDIQIHMHIHETIDEIENSVANFNKRPIQRLHDMGMLSQRLNAVHMTQLEQNDIDLITEYGVHVIHCPESNLKLASGFCPVQTMIDNGINIGLGTDGAASNNDLDMLGEMKTAALLSKGLTGDCTSLPAHTVLEMATINGASALGLDQITGSLVKGKEADMVAINLECVESQPLYDPVSQIVYSTNRSQVSDVWVAGKQLLKEKHLTTINIDSLLAGVHDWQELIRS